MTHELMCALLSSSPYPTPAPWRVLTKTAFFIGLIGTIGGSLAYAFVVAPVLAGYPRDRPLCRWVAGVVLACIGTEFLVALYFQLAGVVARKTPMPFGGAVAPAQIWAYLTAPAQSGQWISTGWQTALQYGLWAMAALALVALWVPRWRSTVGALSGVSAGMASAAWLVTAIPTNLTTATPDGVADGLFEHLHVVAVSAWAGGIAVLTSLALTTRRRLTPAAGGMWARLWTRFSKIALISVGCVLVSGAWLSWKRLGHPTELLTTAFGRVLLIKVTLVATMIAVGGIHEFVLMPRIARARAAGDDGSVFRLAVRVFPKWTALEAVLAFGVLVVLAFLTGSGRMEAGDVPEPIAGPAVLAIGAAWAAVLAVSLITTSRMSERLAERC